MTQPSKKVKEIWASKEIKEIRIKDREKLWESIKPYLILLSVSSFIMGVLIGGMTIYFLK